MDREAFEHAVLEHKDRVHAYAVMMLRDVEEARDVSQEALIRLWENWRRIDETGRKAWLMRITHNLCIDRIRRRRVRGEVELDNVIPLHRDPAPGPGQIAWSGQVGQALGSALSALSDTDRAVVVMREIQGQTYEEIAATLELPLGTLKARLHRARERLRERLVRAGVAP